ITEFIDDLSVWYLRRSRERFKEESEDKKAALATLRYVLHALSLVLAPSMPFLAEHIFQAVREEEDEESVHLALWPESRATANFLQRMFQIKNKDEQMLAAMSAARNFVTVALMQRSKLNIKVRQPLALLTIPANVGLADEYLQIIADEVNVKKIEKKGNEVVLNINITYELREEGIVRDTIRMVQDARKSALLHHGEHGEVSISVTAENRSVVEKHQSQIEKDTNTEISLQ
ncbi:MAG: class I tRNA ligase family protein, partial [Patescibacteria group bacterium]